MKKIILPLFALTFPIFVYAQHFKEHVHENTGLVTVKMPWSELKTQNKSTFQYFRFIELGSGDYMLNLKIMIFPKSSPIAFTVKQDKQLWLKLANGEVIKLDNTVETESKEGAGAVGLTGSEMHGANLYYSGITNDIMKKMTEHPLVKFRIFTDNSYYDAILKTDGVKLIRKAAQKMFAQEVEMPNVGF